MSELYSRADGGRHRGIAAPRTPGYPRSSRLSTWQDGLAAVARCQGSARRLPECELEVTAWPADRAEFRHDVVVVGERVSGDGLGQAVRVGEPRRRERPLGSLDQRDRHFLAAVDDD